MIKNYIDACMNEYRLEKNRKQMNETSLNENENKNYSDSYQQAIVSNRYQQNKTSNETSGRKLPSLPINSTKSIPKIEDNDDFLPIENGQFSSNINYIQQTQRKSNQQLPQVISFE
jgi:hypothetical protein